MDTTNRDVIRQSVKERKIPHPLTKDTKLWHVGSNVIGISTIKEKML